MELQNMLINKSILETSEILKLPVYVVGGAVRDLILGIETKDLDIVVEGDSFTFSEVLAEKLNLKAKHTQQFLASTIISDLNIDIVSARSEFYESPGSNPLCIQTDLIKDLARRDFSINAIAISFNDYLNRNLDKIIDPENGLIDLKNKKIRVLHDKSFQDDPARIIRLLRYKERFSFDLESKTELLLKEAQSSNYLNYLPNYRLESELKKIISEKNWVDILLELQVYKLLDIKDIERFKTALIRLDGIILEDKIKWKLIKYLILFFSNTTDFMNKMGYKNERIEQIAQKLSSILLLEETDIPEQEILLKVLQ